jgi:hypothetical protein
MALIHIRLAAQVLTICALVLVVPASANVAFNVTPDPGTPQYVIDAFSIATAEWSVALADDITVNINLSYQPLAPGSLGQTASSYVQEDYPSVVAALNASATSPDDASAYSHLQPGSTYSRLINHTTDSPNGTNSATPYVNSLAPVLLTRANAKALGFVGSGPGSDAVMQFNSSAPFDFNPSDGTTSGQFDFATIAAHEIGHALGFDSIVNRLEQIPSTADQLPATILDLFRFSAASLAAGTDFIDNTADSSGKFFSVNGGATSVAPFANGAIYGSGYQADHWKEFSFTGLMDPQSFPGLQRHIGAADLRAFDVIGYKLPEPGAGAILGFALLLFRYLQKRRIARS